MRSSSSSSRTLVCGLISLAATLVCRAVVSAAPLRLHSFMNVSAFNPISTLASHPQGDSGRPTLVLVHTKRFTSSPTAWHPMNSFPASLLVYLVSFLCCSPNSTYFGRRPGFMHAINPANTSLRFSSLSLQRVFFKLGFGQRARGWDRTWSVRCLYHHATPHNRSA